MAQTPTPPHQLFPGVEFIRARVADGHAGWRGSTSNIPSPVRLHFGFWFLQRDVLQSVEPRLQAAAGNLGTCHRHRLHCSVPQRELRLFNPTWGQTESHHLGCHRRWTASHTIKFAYGVGEKNNSQRQWMRGLLSEQMSRTVCSFLLLGK